MKTIVIISILMLTFPAHAWQGSVWKRIDAKKAWEAFLSQTTTYKIVQPGAERHGTGQIETPDPVGEKNNENDHNKARSQDNNDKDKDRDNNERDNKK